MEEEIIDLASERIPIDTQGEKHDSLELEREAKDLPKYLLGKSYFDCKEYDRATFVLKNCQSLKAKFLKLYARYLVISLGDGLTIRLARNGKTKKARMY